MIEMKCCDILGTRILVTNMADTVERIEHDMEELRGKYICVGNVHTTVMAHDDAHYHEVQKSAAFVLPDGKPLSVYSRKHGFPEAERVTGPDLMLELFARENVRNITSAASLLFSMTLWTSILSSMTVCTIRPLSS